MKSIQLIIKGRVQGVFFRKNTNELANKLNIKGFVKNLDNGDLEVVAIGEENNINKLIDFCKKGPKAAEVKEIIIKEIKPNNFNNFEIRY
jgi:acylphosphatase